MPFGLTFSIVRPAVIESAVHFPKIGWNEGINTSAPLIYLINQGPLLVPTTKESVLDVIPVDLVAIGMVLSCAELLENTHKTVYQYGTSASNPLPMYRLVELVSLHKRKRIREEGKNPLLVTVQQRIERLVIIPLEPWVKISQQVKQLGQWLKPLETGVLFTC